MNPPIIFISILATLSSLFGFAQQTPPSARAQDLQASTIVGVVLDANNARIVGATIKIENAKISRRVHSGEEGNFQLELPPDVYQITAEHQGFRKFELSPFRARADACELVNIHMDVEVPRSTKKVN